MNTVAPSGLNRPANQTLPTLALSVVAGFASVGQDPQENPMSDAPHIAQKSPYPTALEAGKTYFWCACGQSKNQPFCDGSHKLTAC